MAFKIKVAAFSALSVGLMSAVPAYADTSTRSRELYAIFDFTTSAPKPQVIKATLDGMAMNISRSDTMTPVVMDEPPATAARFKIVDALAGNPMAAMLAMAPASTRMQFKKATCDGAVWVADAVREVEGLHQLRLSLCLFPRQGGYQLDMYGIETQDRGGGLDKIIGRAISNKIVGTPDAWVSKTLLDMVRAIRERTQAQVKYVEGSLDFQGEPWMQESQLTAAQEHLAGH